MMRPSQRTRHGKKLLIEEVRAVVGEAEVDLEEDVEVEVEDLGVVVAEVVEEDSKPRTAIHELGTDWCQLDLLQITGCEKAAGNLLRYWLFTELKARYVALRESRAVIRGLGFIWRLWI